MEIDTDDYLTIRELAELLDISRQWATDLVRRGAFPGVIRLGGRSLIPRSAAESYESKPVGYPKGRPRK